MKRTPLARSGPIKRHSRKDPVTPELRAAVLERDGGCVAPRLVPAGELAASYGWVIVETSKRTYYLDACSGQLTLDHVKDQPRMGVRAPSDMAHLVTLCAFHHLDSGWATSHRPELREYLARVSA